MKLKIESDGTRTGTKVLTESDEKIENVKEIEWKFSLEHPLVTVILTIEGMALDLPCEPEKEIL
jgi:hypothetical protein